MKVGIIILNLNQRKLVEEVLPEIEGQTYTDWRIYIIDNGSREKEQVADLAHDKNKITYINTGRNTGFTGGNNVGIKKAITDGCKYIWILNNDVRLEPGVLQKLVQYLVDHPDAGAVAPKIMYESERGRIWYAGGIINWQKPYPYDVNTHVGEQEIDEGQYDTETKTDFISGASMLCRSKILAKLNGFDDRYFAYFEDADLSLRIKELGYELVYLPSAKMYHMVGMLSGVTSPRSSYYQIRNSLLFVTEWGSLIAKIKAYLNVKIIVLKNLIKLFIPQKREFARAQLKAVFDFVRGQYGLGW